MAKFLEVIVTSLHEAIEAEAGGADRLELVRDLAVGGLTPSLETVAAVLGSVKLPVRVMLRDSANMSTGSPGELRALQAAAKELSRFPVGGLVFGFIAEHEIDIAAMTELTSAAPQCHVTFHRAFDELTDPIKGIERLRQLPQIDRILTTGGKGDWAQRKARLIEWQRAAAPNLKMLVGAGVCSSIFSDLANTPEIEEIHVGRAARVPQTVSGQLQSAKVRALKSALQ